MRTATALAKEKLLEGAGDLVDPLKRSKAVAAVIKKGVTKAYSTLPAEVVTYLCDTSAAMLEEKLGGEKQGRLRTLLRPLAPP